MGLRCDLCSLEHKSRLRHMHTSTDTKGIDNHMIIGEGDVDLVMYLDTAREHGCRVVLEAKAIDGLRRSVEWQRNIRMC